jgi:hypothetical protein
MEDAKNTNEKLSIHLARHEANGTARQLALAYADQVSVYKRDHYLRRRHFFRGGGVKILPNLPTDSKGFPFYGVTLTYADSAPFLIWPS